MIGSRRQKVDVKGASVVSTDDTQWFRYAVLETLGKAQKSQAFSPYGLCTNPPDGSLGIAFNIQGIASNTVVFIDDPKNRKKGLNKGEVAIVNYLTGAFVFVKSDGGIDIENSKGAKIKLLPDGTIEMTGYTKIIGDLEVTGKVTATDYEVPGEPSYVNHAHDKVETGTDTSGGIV